MLLAISAMADGFQVGTTSSGGVPGNAATATVASNVLTGRTFYVATNGNDSTAQIGNKGLPWNAVQGSSTWTVLSFATNSGDVVYVLNGYYLVTNLAPVVGVTIRGQTRDGVIIAGAATANQPTFSPGSWCRLENFTWLVGVTNSQSTPGFLYNDTVPISSSNIWVQDVTMSAAGIDIVHRGPAPGVPGPACTFLNCQLGPAPWDISSGDAGNITAGIVSIACTFIAQNSWNGNITHVSPGQMPWNDYGSTFINFTNGAIGGRFVPHGSIFTKNATNLFPLNVSGGTYYDADNQHWYSLGVGWNTNVISQTLTYTYNPTNFNFINASNSAVNQTYVLSNAYAPGQTAQMIWTNTANNGYTAQWNNPAVFAANGSTYSVLSIMHGSQEIISLFPNGAGFATFNAAVLENQLEWANAPNYGDTGLLTAATQFYTNSITTNLNYGAVYSYTNAGILVSQSNIVVASGSAFYGSGFGLTNSTLSFLTNWASGQRFTNSTTHALQITVPTYASSPATTLGRAGCDGLVQQAAGLAYVPVSAGAYIEGGVTSILATNYATISFFVAPGWGYCPCSNLDLSGSGYTAGMASTISGTTYTNTQILLP